MVHGINDRVQSDDFHIIAHRTRVETPSAKGFNLAFRQDVSHVCVHCQTKYFRIVNVQIVIRNGVVVPQAENQRRSGERAFECLRNSIKYIHQCPLRLIQLIRAVPGKISRHKNEVWRGETLGRPKSRINESQWCVTFGLAIRWSIIKCASCSPTKPGTAPSIERVVV